MAGWFATFQAAAVAVGEGMKAFNRERALAKEEASHQTGASIQRSEDDRATKEKMLKVADAITTQMDDDELDALAMSLARGRRARRMRPDNG